MDDLERLVGCRVVSKEAVKSLWKGYGTIYRVKSDTSTFILKHISAPEDDSEANRQKIESYRVEERFYRTVSQQSTRIPKYITSDFRDSKNFLLLLEDLDSSGFPGRYSLGKG